MSYSHSVKTAQQDDELTTYMSSNVCNVCKLIITLTLMLLPSSKPPLQHFTAGLLMFADCCTVLVARQSECYKASLLHKL